MPTQITSMFGRLASALRGFSIAQRTIALIGLAVLALGIAALVAWTSKPAYTPLFSGLQPADANTIVEQLRTDGVPYELTGGGGTILVPEEYVYDQRLKAAAAGLPTSSNGGYSLLDEMGVTSSEFQQSVTYKRALEGELANTVAALKGVRTASVRLAIPEETVFVSEQTDPTASVFIETEPGVTLTADQVQAVVHLTSASIDGMKPENVAVIDSEGTVLSAVGVGATGGADKQASDYEERVRTAVQTMLDRVVGSGNSTVAVAADMSYESAERIEESFATPDGAPALNESTTSEEYEGSGGGAAGVLGPDNIAAPAAEGGEGTFNSETTTRNNAVNKVTESRTIPAGAINRQTVSVAVDEDAAGDFDAATIEALVSAAAGIDADRGDTVTVEVVPFSTAGAEDAEAALKAAEEAEAAERQGEILRTVIITIGAVVVVFLALFVYARKSRRQRREPIDLGELREEHEALNAAARRSALEGSAAPAALAPPVTTGPLPAVPPPAPAAGPAVTHLPEPATTQIAAAPALIPSAAVPGAAMPAHAAPATTESKRAEIDVLAGTDPEKTAEYLRSLMDDRTTV